MNKQPASNDAVVASPSSSQGAKATTFQGWLVVAVILAAANLRPSIISVGPVVRDIQIETGLASATLGLLVTLPLLAFGAVSPFASRFAARVGMEWAMVISMIVLAIGVAWRSIPGELALFGGTCLLGTGIAIGNVLGPAVIRRNFSQRLGLMTGVFVAFMAGTGGVGAAIAVPVANLMGWRLSLAMWALPALLAAMAWVLPAWRAHTDRSTDAGGVSPARINVWRSRLAWQVTAFMTIQALVFYALIAWLPTLLRDYGVAPEQAGYYSTAMQLSGIIGSVLSPVLANRAASQSWQIVWWSVYEMLAFAVLAYWPDWIGSIVLCGFACGATLGLSVSLFSLRTSNSRDTAALSGMAQSIGYGLGAAGPVVFGWLHDRTAAWTAPVIMLIALSVLQAWAGWCAGKAKRLTVTGRA